MYIGMNATRHDGRPSIADAINQIPYVAAGNIGYGPVSPRREKFSLNNTLNFAEGLVVGLIAFQPLASHLFKISSCRLALADFCRISPRRNGLPSIPPCLPRLREREGWICAQRHPAQLPPKPIKEDKTFRATIGNTQGEPGEAFVEMLDLA
jgi:hypothetical protein